MTPSKFQLEWATDELNEIRHQSEIRKRRKGTRLTVREMDLWSVIKWGRAVIKLLDAVKRFDSLPKSPTPN